MSPRLPLQHVTCDCKVCDTVLVLPASSGQEAWLLQTSQGLFPQLRWLTWLWVEGKICSPTAWLQVPVQVILQLQQLWTMEELAKKCRSVALLNFLACLWLQWEQESHSLDYLSIWHTAVVRPEALFSAVANDSPGSGWLCLCSVAEAKSCAFSLLQSDRNMELKNGIVQGHAYTITAAEKVRSGTCSWLEILCWGSTAGQFHCFSSQRDLN